MKNLAYAFIIVTFLLLGYYIFPTMSLLLFVWFGIFSIIRVRKLDKKLNRNEKTLFFMTVFAYPLLESIIKFFIIRNIIPYSWNFLNRIEHFLSAIGIGILFYPIFKPTLDKLGRFESFLFLVFTIVFIGNLNEFFEYVLRIQMDLHYKFSIYYWDTIYDMFINIIGAIFGSLIVSFVRKVPD
jgi:hypothetical protein